MQTVSEIGCLLIDDLLPGGASLAPLEAAMVPGGFRAARFSAEPAPQLHHALQRAYQRVRRDGDVNALVGLGAGCDAALALAGQLPVDRLALLGPTDWRMGGPWARPLRRVREYARRGAVFCVADVLLMPGADMAPCQRLRRALCNSRVTLFRPSEAALLKDKDILKTAILHFLRHGVLPKSLAENPEMCIIYG